MIGDGKCLLFRRDVTLATLHHSLLSFVVFLISSLLGGHGGFGCTITLDTNFLLSFLPSVSARLSGSGGDGEVEDRASRMYSMPLYASLLSSLCSSGRGH